MNRRRARSLRSNCRYPEAVRSGSIRPWLSRNRIFETEMSGNSSRRRLITSPMLISRSSAIAVGNDEVEPADEDLVAGAQRRLVHAHLVDIGAVGGPAVLHPERVPDHDEPAVLPGHGDVVEEDVALGVPADGGDPLLEQVGDAAARAALHHEGVTLDPSDVGSLLPGEGYPLALLERQEEDRRVRLDLGFGVGRLGLRDALV